VAVERRAIDGVGSVARRKQPQEREIPGEVMNEVPQWVLESAFLRGATRSLGVGTRDSASATISEIRAEQRRLRAAGEAWCAERGLSYCMTVLGWRHPSPSESAAGHTCGAGATYARAMLHDRGRR
jgi:hypothetical protein